MGLAQELVSPSSPVPAIRPISPPPSSEPDIHPAAKYLRRIGLGSLFLGVARLIPPSLFWWQSIFIWVAGFAFIGDIWIERWNMWVKIVASLIILALEASYTIGVVFVPAPIVVSVLGSTAEYAPNTSVAGISWSSKFAEVDISINNPSSFNYEDVDITLRPDRPVADIGQQTAMPGVSFNEAKLASSWYNVLEGATGRQLANPLVTIATTEGYRMRCPVLPSMSAITIVMALATVVQARDDVGPFDRLYILKLPFADSKGNTDGFAWLGHKENGTRIDDLYESSRIPATSVYVEARYTAYQRRRRFSSMEGVRDMPSMLKDAMQRR